MGVMVVGDKAVEKEFDGERQSEMGRSGLLMAAGRCVCPVEEGRTKRDRTPFLLRYLRADYSVLLTHSPSP